jgi:hypothetical protein
LSTPRSCASSLRAIATTHITDKIQCIIHFAMTVTLDTLYTSYVWPHVDTKWAPLALMHFYARAPNYC